MMAPSSSSSRSCRFSTASSCTSARFKAGSGEEDSCPTKAARPPRLTNFLRYSSFSMQMLRSVVAAAARMPATGESTCFMRSSKAPASYASTVFSGHSAVRKLSATTAVCTRSVWSERKKSTSGEIAPASRIFRFTFGSSRSATDARIASCVPASAPTVRGSSAQGCIRSSKDSMGCVDFNSSTKAFKSFASKAWSNFSASSPLELYPMDIALLLGS
mmetsp:Transcript_117913/g.328486  ORF Transcript_117913/g.328486 Transcript_117913/m.328486 type:complete len:217 (-) Transcript_117913:212-862(-)